MKLFFKILFFIFTMIIITVGEVKSSTVITTLREETSYSSFQKSQLGAILFESHNANSCLNERNVVTCSKRGVNVEESVAKGGRTLVTEGLETFNGVKAFRMSKGTNSSKAVIIGRNMDDVKLYKQGLEAKGVKVEIFGGKKIDGTNVIDEAVQDAWNEAVDKAAEQGRRLTDAEVRLTTMYKANQEWIEQMVKEGYDIYDIGNLRSLAGEGLNSGWYSPFYDMEIKTVFP